MPCWVCCAWGCAWLSTGPTASSQGARGAPGTCWDRSRRWVLAWETALAWKRCSQKGDRGFPLHLSVCLSPRHPQIWGLTIVLSRIWKIRGEMPFVRLAQRTAARGFGQPAPGERCSSEVQVKPDSILSLNSNILMGYFMTIPPPPLKFWQFAHGGCSAIK